MKLDEWDVLEREVYCEICDNPLDNQGFCDYCYQTQRLEDDSE